MLDSDITGSEKGSHGGVATSLPPLSFSPRPRSLKADTRKRTRDLRPQTSG